jgi:hypothetical protein
MFLYTIIPLEYIFEEEDEIDQTSKKGSDYEIKKGSASLLVSSAIGGQARISRIIRTNPQDYLNPDWQPGAILPES